MSTSKLNKHTFKILACQGSRSNPQVSRLERLANGAGRKDKPGFVDLECRGNSFSQRADRLESRSSSEDCHNGMKVVDPL